MLTTQRLFSAGLAAQPVTRTPTGSRLEAASHDSVAPKAPGTAARRPRGSTSASGMQRPGSSDPSAAKRDKKGRSHECGCWLGMTAVLTGHRNDLLQAQRLMSPLALDPVIRIGPVGALMRRLWDTIGRTRTLQAG